MITDDLQPLDGGRLGGEEDDGDGDDGGGGDGGGGGGHLDPVLLSVLSLSLARPVTGPSCLTVTTQLAAEGGQPAGPLSGDSGTDTRHWTGATGSTGHISLYH